MLLHTSLVYNMPNRQFVNHRNASRQALDLLQAEDGMAKGHTGHVPQFWHPAVMYKGAPKWLGGMRHSAVSFAYVDMWMFFEDVYSIWRLEQGCVIRFCAAVLHSEKQSHQMRVFNRHHSLFTESISEYIGYVPNTQYVDVCTVYNVFS